MSTVTAFISELIHAANTVEAMELAERRWLIERAVATVDAQRELLALNGNVVPLEPAFMQDMAILAMKAETEQGIGVLVSGGMLMLAEEIRRLRILTRDLQDS